MSLKEVVWLVDFTIGPISIELADGFQIVVGVGHQDGVFPQLRGEGVGKLQAFLAFGPLLGRPAFRRERILHGTTHHDHTTRTAPAGQFQRGLDGVIAAADIVPVVRRPEAALDQQLHAWALAQLGEIPLSDLFECGHDGLIAKGIVCTDQSGALFRTEFLDEADQARQAVAGRMRFAVLDFGIQYQTQVGNPVGVNDVARSPRLGRIVADLGPVLMPVEQLDRRVRIQDPARRQRVAGALRKRRAQPVRAPGQLRLTDRTLLFRATLERGRQMRQAPTQTFVADDLGHAQDLWCHCVATQPRDMSIASLTIENREHPCPQNISNFRCVGARVGHRRACHPALEESRNLQKLGEERQLPQRSRAAVLVPANLKSAPRGSHPQIGRLLDRFGNRTAHCCHQPSLLKFRLTHRVTLPVHLKAPSALSLPQFQERQVRKIGSLSEAIDTTTSGGRLIFHVFGALAQFERDLIRERTKAGLTAAAARGRKGGRKPVVTADKLQRAHEHIANGLNVREAATRLKVSKTALYAALQAESTADS